MHERSAEHFLRDFHERHPGCTRQAFARGRCVDHGLSSYRLLAELAREDDAILDLGCGDGPLLEELGHNSIFGIDMSLDELRASSGGRSAQGRAGRLPFADASFNLVLSHLAFHIMGDLDAVTREVARVLRPGGRFAAVVGGGPKLGDGFELFLDRALPRVEADQRPPALGDRRARSESGLHSLFVESGSFAWLGLDDHSIDLSGSFEEVWSSLSTIYELSAFRPEQLEALRREFQEACLQRSWKDRVPCTMLLRRVQVARL